LDNENLYQTPPSDDHDIRKDHRSIRMSLFSCMSSVRFVVLVVLSLQNSLFTLLRRYSQGILLESYSKYECLLLGEFMKMIFSAWMIRNELQVDMEGKRAESTRSRLAYLVRTSRKLIGLALIYGAMNILSFVSLRNIGAGLFTIFAQTKIITTATFSAVILQRSYSWTKWRALTSLMVGVVLFSHPIWDHSSSLTSSNPDANPWVGTVAVLIEVLLSGL
jgi:UDP-sugar transporter A1/2/3